MELNFASKLNCGNYDSPTFYKLYINNIYVGNYYSCMKNNPDFAAWSTEIWDKMSKEERSVYPHYAYPPRQIVSHYNILSENGRLVIATVATLEKVYEFFINKCVI